MFISVIITEGLFISVLLHVMCMTMFIQVTVKNNRYIQYSNSGNNYNWIFPRKESDFGTNNYLEESIYITINYSCLFQWLSFMLFVS